MNEFIGNTPQIPKGIKMPVFSVGFHSRRELVWVADDAPMNEFIGNTPQIPKGIEIPL